VKAPTDWLSFFEGFFTARAEQIEVILDAAGCREGWLQGEFFLAGREFGLSTNAGKQKFDLRCEHPPMIAELKVCGGNYAPKMKGFIEGDVRKLRRASARFGERYMILVVNTRHTQTELGQWLMKCELARRRYRELRLSPRVTVRMWELE